jgi:DNA-directed RNA polymerase
MKALLRFANGKPLGEHGAHWLAMHGANVAGND